MEWIRSLQAAIDYIEEHIFEPINYDDVAAHIYSSNFHFHRTFSMLTGVTANEYIRNRRLSMAGQELSMSNAKVIDIALKYGYESPESFTKAFSRFHGITPNAAKRAGASLKSFNRLVIKIKLEGGTTMDYRIESKGSIRLLTKVKSFRNEIINEDGNNEIPKFWQECIDTGVIDILHKNTNKHNLFGACSPLSKKTGCFDYGIGVECGDIEVPDGYDVWMIKPSMWAVFKCIGKDPECIGETWERIFSEFLPQAEYEMLEDTDFELYPDDKNSDCFCEIWIPVKKRI